MTDRSTRRLPGRLRLSTPVVLRSRLTRWVRWEALPEADEDAAPELVLETGPAPSDAPEPVGLPTLRLGTAEVRITEDEAHLMDTRSGARGTLRLAEGRGTLRVPADEAPLDDLLTVATALLLGRRGRALVHAGAVTAPSAGDGAWLVAGDTRSGKSTTCATLGQAGWGFLSDDQAVLTPGADGPRVEGWPRPLRLDTGWPDGPPTGRRKRVSAAEAGLTRASGPAPLRGVLLPTLTAEAPTRAERVPAGEALAALVRQSPWLMADRATGEAVLELLESVAALPAYRLALGRDAFGDAGPIERALAEAGA